VGVQWLRWRNKGALAGGWLREEKKLERWGRRLGLGQEKKLDLGFFRVCPKFLSFKKFSSVNFPPLYIYGWMFTYIENLYTFYLRKYYNNY
jgi:hypothetical protein